MKHISAIALLCFIYISCNSDERNQGKKPHEILVVQLKIQDEIQPLKVILSTQQATDQVNFEAGKNQQNIELKTVQLGEGTCTICVYTQNDTLCSPEYYIEGGYRPVIQLKNKQFKIIKGA